MKKKLQPAAQIEDDRTARFRHLFDTHYRLLVAYAVRRTISDADAHDVVAEAFTVAWRRLDDVPPGDDALPWLYGVARRCLANQRRQEGRRTRLGARLSEQPADAEMIGNPENTGVSAEVLAVRSALARLRPADQEILRLVAWEALSHPEVAVALGVSPNAVAIRIHRARRRLERILSSEGIVDSRKDET